MGLEQAFSARAPWPDHAVWWPLPSALRKAEQHPGPLLTGVDSVGRVGGRPFRRAKRAWRDCDICLRMAKAALEVAMEASSLILGMSPGQDDMSLCKSNRDHVHSRSRGFPKAKGDGWKPRYEAEG